MDSKVASCTNKESSVLSTPVVEDDEKSRVVVLGQVLLQWLTGDGTEQDSDSRRAQGLECKNDERQFVLLSVRTAWNRWLLLPALVLINCNVVVDGVIQAETPDVGFRRTVAKSVEAIMIVDAHPLNTSRSLWNERDDDMDRCLPTMKCIARSLG
jgi:hypothetical protein